MFTLPAVVSRFVQCFVLLAISSSAALAQVTFIKLSQMVFANDVSEDGQVVVGNNADRFDYRPVMWTPSTGVVPVFSPYFTTERVSGDGSVIAGARPEASGFAAYRWSSASGIQTVATVPGWNYRYVVDGMSEDGSTLLLNLHDAGWTSTTPMLWRGSSNSLTALPMDFSATALTGDGQAVGGTLSGERNPVVWTAAGFESLDRPPGTSLYHVSGASDDGRYFAGWASTTPIGPIPRQAILWDREGSAQLLGLLNGSLSTDALAVSNTGNLVVGRSTIGLNGFLWTPESGILEFRDVLAQSYGLADQMDDWGFLIPTAMSGDGRYLVGYGSHLREGQTSWFLDRGEIPPPISIPVPEPASFGALGVLVLCALGQKRWRMSR